MRGFVLVVASLLAGCQPQARDAEHFKVHQAEAARVVANCRAGRHRGRECETAQAGVAAADAERRMKLFRRGFE